MTASSSATALPGAPTPGRSILEIAAGAIAFAVVQTMPYAGRIGIGDERRVCRFEVEEVKSGFHRQDGSAALAQGKGSDLFLHLPFREGAVTRSQAANDVRCPIYPVDGPILRTPHWRLAQQVELSASW